MHLEQSLSRAFGLTFSSYVVFSIQSGHIHQEDSFFFKLVKVTIVFVHNTLLFNNGLRIFGNLCIVADCG